jgi:hypothetical protein
MLVTSTGNADQCERSCWTAGCGAVGTAEPRHLRLERLPHTLSLHCGGSSAQLQTAASWIHPGVGSCQVVAIRRARHTTHSQRSADRRLFQDPPEGVVLVWRGKLCCCVLRGGRCVHLVFLAVSLLFLFICVFVCVLVRVPSDQQRRLLYMRLWKSKLVMEANRLTATKPVCNELADLERVLSYRDIAFFRSLARMQLLNLFPNLFAPVGRQCYYPKCACARVCTCVRVSMCM